MTLGCKEKAPPIFKVIRGTQSKEEDRGLIGNIEEDLWQQNIPNNNNYSRDPLEVEINSSRLINSETNIVRQHETDSINK